MTRSPIAALVLFAAAACHTAPGPVVLSRPADVLAAVDVLSRPSVAVARGAGAAGEGMHVATLGPLPEAERSAVLRQLAEEVLLETERIEHGRASPAGYRARRVEVLRAIDRIRTGRYWVVASDMATFHGAFYPFLADETLAWYRMELAPQNGRPRVLAIPLDLRPEAVAQADARELSAFAATLEALPFELRAKLLGDAVRPLALPYRVPSTGFATRIGTLPGGSVLTAELLLELPR